MCLCIGISDYWYGSVIESVLPVWWNLLITRGFPPSKRIYRVSERAWDAWTFREIRGRWTNPYEPVSTALDHWSMSARNMAKPTDGNTRVVKYYDDINAITKPRWPLGTSVTVPSCRWRQWFCDICLDRKQEKTSALRRSREIGLNWNTVCKIGYKLKQVTMEFQSAEKSSGLIEQCGVYWDEARPGKCGWSLHIIKFTLWPPLQPPKLTGRRGCN